MSIKLAVLKGPGWDTRLLEKGLGEIFDNTDLIFADAEIAISDFIQAEQPDLVLAEYNWLASHGFDLIRKAKDQSPDLPFLILIDSWSDDIESFLLEHNAEGIITKQNISRLSFAARRALKDRDYRLELQYNFRVQEALADISIIFNSLESIKSKMDKVLAIIGRVSDVSRVYLFEDFDEGLKCRNTHEWCAPGTEPQIEYLQDLSYEGDIPTWREFMYAEGRIKSNDIRELPEEFRRVLEPQDIKAFLVYPIHIGEVEYGFVGLDETRYTRNWSESLDRMLKTVAGLIANALKEHRVTQQLRKRNEELGIALEEQRLLISEVHHRVKNNLALVSSFLQLEKINQENEELNRILDTNLLRIKSIAIVQELIYESGSLSNVDFTETLDKLFSVIYNFDWGKKPDIRLQSGAGKILLNINQAIPFSLLLSELYYRAFHFLNADSSVRYKIPESVSVQLSHSEGALVVRILDVSLHKILTAVPDIHEFSEIVEVLCDQLNATIVALKDEQQVVELSFKQADKKGSFSAI